MKKKGLFKLSVSLTLSFLLALFLFLTSGSRTYQTLEFKALDLRFTLRGGKIAQAPVLHIDIDDASLDKIGRWPWPRIYHAQLIDTLTECGACQVLMDILFMERLKDDPQTDTAVSEAMQRSNRTYIPCYFNESQTPPPEKLVTLLRKDISVSVEQASQALALQAAELKDMLPWAKRYVIEKVVKETMRAKPGILEEDLLKSIEDNQGWFLFPAEEKYIRESFQAQTAIRLYIDRFAVKYLQKGPWPYTKTYPSLTVPIREYAENLRGSGFINADPDDDGVTRRVPLFIKYDDAIVPQMAVAALMDMLEVKDIEPRSDTVILKGARIQNKTKDIAIPVDQEGCMLINWQGRWGYSFKHLPYHLILRLHEIRKELREQVVDTLSSNQQASQGAGAVEYLRNSEAELKAKLTDMVKGKICIVGLTATGTHDMRPIPLQSNYPLVGTHANLVNTILTQDFIRKASPSLNLFIFLFTALAVGCSSLIKLWKSLFLSVCYAAGYFLVAFFAFDKGGLWIDMVGPESIVLFGFSAITSFRYFTEEKEKLWIKQAFSHYLSKEVINELMDDPDKLKLGGARKNLTVLFSDVRGFTSFSESHQPEEVVAMLNEILTQQVEVVFKYSGTLDKFVGDELMTFFGAPGELHAADHALTAVRTAVEIQAKLKSLQEKWVKEKKEPLQIGIGIHTGDMVVGNMGSAERMDYTVIGDNVNLAARLCSAAGKNEILISETTYEAARDHVTVEKLEPISVKGKSKPVAIYRVVGLTLRGA